MALSSLRASQIAALRIVASVHSTGPEQPRRLEARELRGGRFVEHDLGVGVLLQEARGDDRA